VVASNVLILVSIVQSDKYLPHEDILFELFGETPYNTQFMRNVRGFDSIKVSVVKGEQGSSTMVHK